MYHIEFHERIKTPFIVCKYLSFWNLIDNLPKFSSLIVKYLLGTYLYAYARDQVKIKTLMIPEYEYMELMFGVSKKVGCQFYI